MPIYEYRCSSCGFQKDYLRKLADPVLKVCPECGRETFSKMLTSAGFQLKGSGWYATDFKNPKSTATSASAGKGDAKSDTKTDTKSDSKSDTKSDSKGDTKTDSKSDAKSDSKGNAKSDSKGDAKSDSKTGAASSGAGACS